MESCEEILACSKTFLEKTIKHTLTNYVHEQDCEATFEDIKRHLLLMSKEELSSIQAMCKKCSTLGMTIFSADALNDTVKIVWRMVKDQGGEPKRMLCLFIIGISAILTMAKKRQSVDTVADWETTCIKWLSKQLTIGGKGVTGEGEGSTTDRLKRFFNTPYLHDFD